MSFLFSFACTRHGEENSVADSRLMKGPLKHGTGKRLATEYKSEPWSHPLKMPTAVATGIKSGIGHAFAEIILREVLRPYREMSLA